MKTIILKFAGPLQSWGTNSHFYVRHTDMHPSKSAVVGMIAAAIGLRRDDPRIKTLNDFLFAVRVDQPGTLVSDFHMAHKIEVKKDRTNIVPYLTTRYYLQDAVFVAALEYSDEKTADQIAYALQFPYFQLYMGRRSLPVPADFVLDITSKDLIAALQEVPWQASQWYRQKMKKSMRGKTVYAAPVYADKEAMSGMEMRRRDVTLSLSNKKRDYADRIETEGMIYLNTAEESLEEHDIFAAIGD